MACAAALPSSAGVGSPALAQTLVGGTSGHMAPAQVLAHSRTHAHCPNPQAASDLQALLSDLVAGLIQPDARADAPAAQQLLDHEALAEAGPEIVLVLLGSEVGGSAPHTLRGRRGSSAVPAGVWFGTHRAPLRQAHLLNTQAAPAGRPLTAPRPAPRPPRRSCAPATCAASTRHRCRPSWRRRPPPWRCPT